MEIIMERTPSGELEIHLHINADTNHVMQSTCGVWVHVLWGRGGGEGDCHAGFVVDIIRDNTHRLTWESIWMGCSIYVPYMRAGDKLHTSTTHPYL